MHALLDQLRVQRLAAVLVAHDLGVLDRVQLGDFVRGGLGDGGAERANHLAPPAVLLALRVQPPDDGHDQSGRVNRGGCCAASQQLRVLGVSALAALGQVLEQPRRVTHPARWLLHGLLAPVSIHGLHAEDAGVVHHGADAVHASHGFHFRQAPR